MTVYVDDMQLSAKIGRINARWSHLLADTSEELIEFAKKLGLKEEWIQYPGTWKEHFDVTEPKRQKAIRLGATQIGYISDESIALIKKKQKEHGLH
jgi:hypothetical protein